MKKIIILGVIVLFICMGLQPAFANDNHSFSKKEQQPGGITFMKTYGGKSVDVGYYVQQTTDNGFIIVGETWSFGSYPGDVLLIKTDRYGNKLWQRTLGEQDIREEGKCVQQTTDGGYIITGYIYSYDAGYFDLLLIKTDRYGFKVWDKTIGGANYDFGFYVQQTTDGGYIITGRTDSFGNGSSNVWLIKTDSAGNILLNKTFGGDNIDEGRCVQQTTDGGYIITGETHSYGVGLSNVWLIKTDNNGNKEWDKTFSFGNYDLGYSVQQTTDGGYIITGETGLFGAGDSDVWLIKTDNTGNKEWDRTFGGGKNDTGRYVQQTNDGGYIIVGVTDLFIVGDGDGYSDVWLIKTDNTGNMVWNRTFKGTGWDFGYCVQQTDDGGYIITGEKDITAYSNCDVWLIKTDEFGRSKTKTAPIKVLLHSLFRRFPLLQRLLYTWK